MDFVARMVLLCVLLFIIVWGLLVASHHDWIRRDRRP
jgi:hypothetical protein